MSSTYGKLWRSIDSDESFSELSQAAQHLYMRLIGRSSMSPAGVVDWRPRRMLGLWRGATVTDIEEAARELRAAGYIFFDEETEECLIRSHVRHDDLLKQPNMAVSLLKSYHAIASKTLRRLVVWELQRLHDDKPELRGWSKVRDLVEREPIDPSDDPSVDPSIYPGTDPSVDPEGIPSVRGFSTTTETTTTTNNPRNAASAKASEESVKLKRDDEPQTFAAWYEVYGKKVSRPGAVKAYRKALAKVAADELLTRTTAWVTADRKRPDFDKRYQPHPATWLNEERWNDELPTVSAQKPGQHRLPSAPNLPHWTELEEPPDDLTDEQIVEWTLAQDRKARERAAAWKAANP